jgi:LAO/AO transport system kinase
MVVVEDLLARLCAEPRLLSRIATLVENEDPQGLALLDTIYANSGTAHIVGITGPPGVGKSALIAELVTAARASGRRVAVLAVDPSSPFTGGAVLGDRIRMMQHHGDEGVFVRSMASRGRTGGLAWATAEVAHLLDAAGFPLILVETIGTGQDGVDIAALADTVVVVTAPGLGDGVQTMKSGLLEAGDLIVVNKADRPESQETVRSLQVAVALAPPDDGRVTPVLATSAASGDGVGDLLGAIDAHRSWLANTGFDRANRALSAQAEILSALRLTLDRQSAVAADTAGPFAALVARVARRELTARQAVAEITAALAERSGSAARTSGAIRDEGGCRAGTETVVDVDNDDAGRT